MTHDPNVISTAAVTLIVGWFMLKAGLHKSALELRRPRRICPSCGREVRADRCNCTV
jgi:hypothetical protein